MSIEIEVYKQKVLNVIQNHIKMLERLKDSSFNVNRNMIEIQLQSYKNTLKLIEEIKHE